MLIDCYTHFECRNAAGIPWSSKAYQRLSKIAREKVRGCLKNSA